MSFTSKEISVHPCHCVSLEIVSTFRPGVFFSRFGKNSRRKKLKHKDFFAKTQEIGKFDPKRVKTQAFSSKNSLFPRKTRIFLEKLAFFPKNSRIFEKLKQNFSKNSRNRKVHLPRLPQKRLKKHPALHVSIPLE